MAERCLQTTIITLLGLLVLLSCPTLGESKIDLQWSICDKDAATVLHKLGHGEDEPYKEHPITYYDAAPPKYTRRGLGLRTKVKGRHPPRPISMIKARFNGETENVPSEADCVWDRYGNATYYTCGMLSPLDDKPTIWSEEQMAFAERYQDIDWASLVPYGPFMNPKWKLNIAGYKAVFDDVKASAHGSDLHLMEIEVEVDSSEGVDVHRNITKYLRDRQVVICDPELPKTLRLFDALNRSLTSASDGRQVVMNDE